MTKRLETQALNALRRAGIRNPDTLTAEELLKVPGLGPKGVEYLISRRKIKVIDRGLTIV